MPNLVHGTSQPHAKSERQEDAQAIVTITDGASGDAECVSRTH